MNKIVFTCFNFLFQDNLRISTRSIVQPSTNHFKLSIKFYLLFNPRFIFKNSKFQFKTVNSGL